jgi:hypothetical protein
MKDGDIFIPDDDTQKQYKEQLAVLTNNRTQDNLIINLGKLPEVYSFLGIPDKELKTNNKMILKAIGEAGINKHHVPVNVLENLLPLIYDPEAVFKSLSTSKNPDAFVAVLNAKTNKKEQIIAILSPSKDGQGFTFIPSVYEKNNFENLLKNINKEQKVLYIKEKGSEIWGQHQLLPRHKTEPSNKNILTKNDIVKLFKEKYMEQEKHVVYTQLRDKQYYGDYEYRTCSVAEWNDIKDPYYKLIATCSNEAEANLLAKELNKNDRYRSSFDAAREAAKNILSKEKIMSDSKDDAYENYMGELDPNTVDLSETVNEPKERNLMDESFKNAVYQRIVVTKALKEGTLACLPNADGYADTRPVVNLVNGTHYHGDTLLVLKEHQRENKFPSSEYVTHAQIEQAKKDKPGLYIREGQKGVSIYFNTKNDKTGEWEIKTARLFNVAQTSKPWEMKNWAEQKQQEEQHRKTEWLKTQYGENHKPDEPKPKQPGPEVITCSSTEPSKYLGEYLAAVSMGSKFKVTPEQAAEFTKNFGDSLYEKMINKETKEPILSKNGNSITDPFKLSKISNEANKHCVEFIKTIRTEARKVETPEQKMEQTQSRGRGI